MGGTITPFPGAAKSHQPRPLIPESHCEHRQVTTDGRVVCRKVGRGDTEVSVALCTACPAALIQCSHLRFTLRKHAPPPIVVRYAGGRTEVWDDMPPSMHFERAACALCRDAIHTPADCAGCTLRAAVPAEPAVAEPRRKVAVG